MSDLPKRLGNHLHAAVHAGRGAPRLYRSARRAGAGRLAALRLMLWSGIVLFIVAPRAAGVPGRQNAVRHFVWQALITVRYGEAVARSVADAQEAGSPDHVDSSVDRHNNTTAQAYAAAHATDLRALSSVGLVRELLRAGLDDWDAGALRAR